ncbi:MAG: hypothetical protein ABFD24_11180 [Anaerolineaceae bacterium]|jgi:hypothetical protein
MNLVENDSALDQFTSLEHKLASVLRPVRPDPAYVQRLGHSLGRAPSAILERNSITEPILMIVLGLAAGVTAAYLIHKLAKQ